jgi:peroxiredoxin
MKKLLFLFFLSTKVFAQLPARPEDISPLLIGEKIPVANLKNEKGQTVSLASLLAEKPTVLIFYRGGWCPYCNKHLSDIAEAEAKILALGYQIVAISPDKATKLEETAGKQKLNYHLLSDSAGQLIREMGIGFQVPKHYQKTIFDASDGKNTEVLPVPSLFILNQKGEILFEFIQPNFKNRISSKLLLSVLEGLK